MTIEADPAPPPHPAAGLPGLRLPWFWPLVAGLVVLAIPTIIALAGQAWKDDTGAHGPLVLTTGLWLLYFDGLRIAPDARTNQDWKLAGPLLAVALLVYALGRAYDFISLEFLGLYGAFVAVAIRLCRIDKVLNHVFPFFYLLLAVPPPQFFMSQVTAPLQTMVSWISEHFTAMLGLPVAREGVVLYVAQYQLLVEDACSGLNSLFGLIAVSLLYIYLAHRASVRHAMALVAAIIPIAIAVNLLRIMGLILITYHFGDAAAQGFMHATTGLIVFIFGLILIMALDGLVTGLARRIRR